MFKHWFKKSKTVKDIPEADADLSLGALLVRMAKSDDHYHPSEISVVDKVLASQFNLTAVEAAKMRATCETLETLAPDTDKFVQLIRDSISLEQRKTLVASLYEVARADGVKHIEEIKLYERLEHALIDDAASVSDA